MKALLRRLGEASASDRYRRAGFAAMIALVTFVACLSFWPRDRSFIVETETNGVEIAFDRQASSLWRLPRSIVCVRRPRALRTAPPAPHDAVCDARLFAAFETEAAEIAWPPGSRVNVSRHGRDAPLIVRVVDQPPGGDAGSAGSATVRGETLSAGSLVIVRATDWADSGALVFSGTVVAGSVPSAGARDLLIRGRYEIREQLLLRGDRPVRIAEGDLLPGDQVAITTRDGRASRPVIGFLTQRDAGGEAGGLQAVMYSPLGDTGMTIDRLGTEQTIIGASWFDRATSDPLLIGLTALLAFVLAAYELLSRLWPERSDAADGACKSVRGTATCPTFQQSDDRGAIPEAASAAADAPVAPSDATR
ncbi:hypothetical protein [Methylobrevis albus]|uniref:Uncharacterized protein n=1 Tax=Methylobrevis albus TaxID=2793297 RepID=A0A931N167_9HYPH|nr:hypothetical protein [Methylobrevis albus]MBH0239516.1 hypothetical protein [Methylobrevis albus]